MYCWTCGHYAQADGRTCLCCGEQIVQRERIYDKKIREVKNEIDNILKEKIEPEFRFRIQGWVCWIKLSDLEDYQNLKDIQKPDKYYFFLKGLIENENIARVVRP